MSRDSSEQPVVNGEKHTDVTQPIAPREKGWFVPMLGHGAWLAVSFVSASMIVSLLALLMKDTIGPIDKYIDYNISLILLSVIAYGLMLSIQVLGLHYIFHQPVSWKIFGLNKGGSRWKDAVVAVVGFLVYAVGAAALMMLVAKFVPVIDVNQLQNIGFDKTTSALQNILVAILFIVIDPIFEESIFRGFLYGQLKRIRVPTWLNIIFTSALFGAAHLQWNVGINVFALSVVLCLMREYTGSIYAGMILHGLKNAIAFYYVFLYPLGVSSFLHFFSL